MSSCAFLHLTFPEFLYVCSFLVISHFYTSGILDGYMNWSVRRGRGKNNGLPWKEEKFNRRFQDDNQGQPAYFPTWPRRAIIDLLILSLRTSVLVHTSLISVLEYAEDFSMVLLSAIFSVSEANPAPNLSRLLAPSCGRRLNTDHRGICCPLQRCLSFSKPKVFSS